MKLNFESREQWLAARNQGIGASEVAGVLRPHLLEHQQCPFNTPYKVFCRKRGLLMNDTISEEGEWGLRAEPMIAQAIMDKTGCEVVLADQFALYRADDKPHLQASPDAFMKRPDRPGAGVLQIKNPGFYMRDEWRDGPPMYYVLQVQAEMRCTGAGWGALAGLIGGNRLYGPYYFDYDAPLFTTIETHLDEFWQLVLKGDEPPFDDSDVTMDVLKALYKKDNGKAIELTEEHLAMVLEWRTVRQQRLDAEKIEKRVKATMAGFMKDNAIGLLPNGKKLLYTTHKRAGYTVQPTEYRQFDYD
jgi:putative phage-type endonuclease